MAPRLLPPAGMKGYPPAPVPPEASGLDQRRRGAAGCRACDLFRG
jgi:hypothetical protein